MGVDSAPQPLGPAQVFERGWRLWWRNFGALAVGTLVVYIPMQILNLVVLFVTQPGIIEQYKAFPEMLRWSEELSTNPNAAPPEALMNMPTVGDPEYSLFILGQVLSVVIAVFGTALFLSMAVEITTAAAGGAKLGWREALDRAVDRVRSMAFLTFLWGFFLMLIVFVSALVIGLFGGIAAATGGTAALALIVPVAILLVFVPVTWLAVMWAVPVPALMYEGQKNFQALGRSYRLVKGRGWATFGVFVLMSLVQLIVTILLIAPGVAALFLDVDTVMAIALLVAGGLLLTVVVYPMLGGVISSIYLDLRLRKDGLGPAEITRPPQRAPEPSAEPSPPAPTDKEPDVER
jgi:hypothetical protein